MDISVKYQEIIKKSLLVRSGSPAVYHLTPKREIIGTNMTKLTVGEKDPEKTNRTVLLVGDTGAGKSTLINALVNYTMGVKWEDDVWFKMVVESGKEKDGDQTESPTTDVVVYQICGFEGQTLPYSLTLIDTPGFGDTRGIEHDATISQRLSDLFCSKDRVHEVDVVGLVLKSSEKQLSDRQSYILDSVVSLFGKDMEKNLVALITHSDGLTPENALQALDEAKIKVAKSEDDETIYFLFNNLQSRQRTQKETVPLKFAWETSTGGMNQFQDFLEKTAPLTSAADILSERVESSCPETEKFTELKQEAASGTEKNSNVSMKLQEIIKKSLHVRSGSPTIYHLTPNREVIGSNMTKLTVGEKDPEKTNRTVLVVGDTGTGKSTLINALVNYTMGVKWEDDVWFKMVVESGQEKDGDQTESQTTDVVVYQIFGFEGQTLPYSLTIIDTPGFGSTAGHEYDVIISQRLLDLFRSEDGVHEINTVGLVLKSTENRMKDEMRYILDSVMSLFGKDMENNIVALITHSDGIDPGNTLQALEEAKVKVAKDEDDETIHFMFNNRQTTVRTKKNKSAMKSTWDMTTDQIHQFTEFLGEAEPRSVIKAVEVLNDRIRLTACIQNLQERVQFIELKQRQIQQTQEALKKHEVELKNDQNFTVEVDEVYKDREEIRGGKWGLFFYEGAVCCTVCEENCHYPGCTVAWYPRDCEVMKDGHCTSCTGKCPVTNHVKEEWRYVIKTKKVKKTLEDVKSSYENNKLDAESLLKELQKEMEKLKTDYDQWLDEAFQHIMSLEQIALNVDSLSTYVHLDVLIEKMKERGDTEKVKKLEEIKIRMDQDKKKSRALRFLYRAAAGAGNKMKQWFGN